MGKTKRVEKEKEGKKDPSKVKKASSSKTKKKKRFPLLNPLLIRVRAFQKLTSNCVKQSQLLLD